MNFPSYCFGVHRILKHGIRHISHFFCYRLFIFHHNLLQCSSVSVTQHIFPSILVLIRCGLPTLIVCVHNHGWVPRGTPDTSATLVTEAPIIRAPTI